MTVPLTPDEVLTYVDRTIDVLERLGGVNELERRLLRDVVLDAVATAAGGYITRGDPP